MNFDRLVRDIKVNLEQLEVSFDHQADKLQDQWKTKRRKWYKRYIRECFDEKGVNGKRHSCNGFSSDQKKTEIYDCR